MPRITPDLVCSVGLVAALVLSIILGGSTELQTNIASGLIGFLGKTALQHEKGEAP